MGLRVVTMVSTFSSSIKIRAVNVIVTKFTKLHSNYVIATNMMVHAWNIDIQIQDKNVLKLRDLP